MDISVVILAAGKGTRMRSAMPKVLHRVADKPLVEHVIHTAHALGAKEVYVVYGHGGEAVPEALSHLDVKWVLQEKQLGTGHAVEQALGDIPDNHLVLVLYGDVPLTRAETLADLVRLAGDESMGLLTVALDDPAGYGRIVRNQAGKVSQIVEHKDASDEQKLINEVNTGILVAPCQKLKAWLGKLENDNSQGEFYLTDTIEMAVKQGLAVNTASPSRPQEVLGVNNKKQLAELERFYQRQAADKLMEAGVTLRDPCRFDLRGELSCGQDVSIDVNVVIEGRVSLGDNVEIASNCVIKNATIGDGVKVLPNTVIEDATIGADSKVGPFARLRPGAELVGDNHIGNFVEIKKAKVGRGSKVNHLSYVGDAEIGSTVNIGAGTITCNYDGANKHLTRIGDDVFVGSCSQLVAPVNIEKGVTIGAGSTITKDVPSGVLALTRAKQIVIEGWKRPQKKNK
ncbi:MAG TPA: UDP-N-acetylglucosamine diphosphorylase/glucosamine-1-phosphate N-acetyltransferase [Candidatus Tenderia sp.]|nr:UDP-N-acetylglucosamine diphosphorylase/glucosamine-1-phosphate N-acetyltransferase [Candidatus Tenderia sp.]